MKDTVLCQRYGTTDGIKHMGMYKRSENGCSTWVTLCTHPTHTDNINIANHSVTTMACFKKWMITKKNPFRTI
jgi:hypothetical protein